MNIEEMLNEIKRQFENEENFTENLEPQAWIYLNNGRSIEITHEEEGIEPDEQFFSVRLHCTESEFDKREYYKTIGVIDEDYSHDTADFMNIEFIRKPLEYILNVNEQEEVL